VHFEYYSGAEEMKLEYEKVEDTLNLVEIASFLDIMIAGLQYARRQKTHLETNVAVHAIETDLIKTYESFRERIAFLKNKTEQGS
jgi:hypothetical protein